MLHDALGGGGVLLCGGDRQTGQRGGVGRCRVKLRRRVLCGLLLRRFLKIRVLLPLADTLGRLLGFVDFNSPVAGHFLRDFIAGFILFYGASPPIRALARAQYSLFSSMPI